MGRVVSDERMSDGEIRSRFEGVAERFRDVDKRFDRMAPLDIVANENGHLRDQINTVRGYAKDRFEELDQASRERADDVEKIAMAAIKSVADASAAAAKAQTQALAELKNTKQTTWSRAATIVGWGIALVAAIIAAKGIK